MPYSRPVRVPLAFVSDGRPGADEFVYCKGCGRQLDGQPRHAAYRVKISVMMCEDCRGRHGHSLVPLPGSPSFCYRCGRLDEIIVERGHYPATHHVCAHCLPDRAAHLLGRKPSAPQLAPSGDKAP